MKSASVVHQTMSVSLACILVSCSMTRYAPAEPTRPEELSRYVLIIKPGSNGQPEHEWISIEDVDLKKFQYSESGIRSRGGSLVCAPTWAPDCDASYERCMTFCNAATVPVPVEDDVYPGSRSSWKKDKKRWCREACMKYYSMCLRGKGPWAVEKVAVQEFSRIDVAVDWVKNHSTELLVGTVVVIAGVVLVVVACAGGGCVALIPIVLIASENHPSGRFSDTQLAGVNHVDPR